MTALPFLDLPPLLGVSGTVRLPGSKSISNRVLLLAGLPEGRTRVHDLLDSDDTRVMLDALEHVMKLGNHEALEDLIRSAADMRTGWQMSGAKPGMPR